jgi:hypothetical protein
MSAIAWRMALAARRAMIGTKALDVVQREKYIIRRWGSIAGGS